MKIIGIDPSFTRLGISILDTESKQVSINKFEGRMGKQFDISWTEAYDRVLQLNALLKVYNVNNAYILSECPFPGGSSSEGLYQLDSMLFLFLKLSKHSLDIVHPGYLKHLHKGTYTKKDSVNLYKKLRLVFEKHGYKFNKNRVCHDEAESFIFLTRCFVKQEIDKPIIKDLLKVNSGFIDAKEKNLF